MRLLLTLALAAVALGGCVEDAATDAVPLEVEKVMLTGQVLTPNFNPVVGASVTMQNPTHMLDDGTTSEETEDITATTDVNGTFTLESYPGSFLIQVEHPDFQLHSGTVTVPQQNLTIELRPVNVDIPFNEEFTFDGKIECAVEYLIITPSCDTLLTFAAERAGQDPSTAAVFETNSVFDITTPRGWQTIILDIRFDGSAHPGIDGLRTSAYAENAEASTGEYQRMRQAAAANDFSMRIDAGQDYGDNVPAPDSDGGDSIRFEFYPHGHADDTLCIPDETPDVDPRLAPGTCFLGVGFAQDITFTATATLFVHEAAPEGWTTLGPN